MIANSAMSYPAAGPHPATLNDLRVHTPVAEDAPSTSVSPLTISSLVLAAVLAIAAFVWLDPLHTFRRTEASPPAPVSAPSAEPARATERQEIVAPLTPVPATKSVEVPIASTPVAQAPHVPAPAVRPRAASTKPESLGNPKNKTNTTIPQAAPKDKAAAPVLLAKPEEGTAPPVQSAKPEEGIAPPVQFAKPEEKTDAPIVPKLGDDTKSVPKPAAANDQTPVTD
jgi:hypothetical protein